MSAQDNIAPVHHHVTSDVPTTTTDSSYGTSSGAGYGASSSTNYSSDPSYTTSDSTVDPSTSDVPTTASDSTLETYQGSKSDMASTAAGPLGTTQGPFEETILQQEGQGGGVPSSVGSQTAEGRGGSIGEAAMGALGYGGSHVERPPKEQGVAEKIVNFLGV